MECINYSPTFTLEWNGFYNQSGHLWMTGEMHDRRLQWKSEIVWQYVTVHHKHFMTIDMYRRLWRLTCNRAVLEVVIVSTLWQWQSQWLSFIVMIVRIDKYRRLWLCQLWSVTDRVRGRVTSLPWSPARAAGSKVFPNLQTILFSTNKPKISTTFKVSSFPFYVWRWESCLQAWTENIFHLVQNCPTFSSASSPMRGRRLSKGSGGNRWEVGNLG